MSSIAAEVSIHHPVCRVLSQVHDPINIKLSDYGISRQSFHEGALGVEGTPGYQAPEIRPGIVYDEKVLSTSSSPLLFSVCHLCSTLAFTGLTVRLYKVH